MVFYGGSCCLIGSVILTVGVFSALAKPTQEGSTILESIYQRRVKPLTLDGLGRGQAEVIREQEATRILTAIISPLETTAVLDTLQDVKTHWKFDPEWFPYINISSEKAEFVKSKTYIKTNFEENPPVDVSPLETTAVLDTENDTVGPFWQYNSEWFPYINISSELAEFVKDKKHVITNFTDWDKIDQNVHGVWPLFNQDPEPCCDGENEPSINFFPLASKKHRSLTIRCFVQGNVYFNVSAGEELMETVSILCGDGKCGGYDFKEYSYSLVHNPTDEGTLQFQLDFVMPENDSFILIDKIVADDVPPPTVPATPTTLAAGTTEDESPSTTSDLTTDYSQPDDFSSDTSESTSQDDFESSSSEPTQTSSLSTSEDPADEEDKSSTDQLLPSESTVKESPSSSSISDNTQSPVEPSTAESSGSLILFANIFVMPIVLWSFRLNV